LSSEGCNLSRSTVTPLYWCDELTVNPAKPSFILINPISKLGSDAFILNYNNESITRNQVVKNLGVTIDECLNWKNNIYLEKA